MLWTPKVGQTFGVHFIVQSGSLKFYAILFRLDGDKISDTYKSKRQEVYLLYT